MYLASLQLSVLQMTAGLAGTEDHTHEMIHIHQQLHFIFGKERLGHLNH